MDEEITAGALDFIERQAKADKPFFCWWNSTKMHIWTHLKDGVAGKTGLGVYPDGMVEHDRQVGQILDKLDELGIADNTIVMYSTDNGAEELSWPDGGALRSAAKRIPTGMAAGACHAQYAGRASSSRVRSPMRPSRTRTCFPPSSPQQASLMSSKNARRALRAAPRTSRSTSTALILCPI